MCALSQYNTTNQRRANGTRRERSYPLFHRCMTTLVGALFLRSDKKKTNRRTLVNQQQSSIRQSSSSLASLSSSSTSSSSSLCAMQRLYTTVTALVATAHNRVYQKESPNSHQSMPSPFRILMHSGRAKWCIVLSNWIGWLVC